jgi:hypothetical protein
MQLWSRWYYSLCVMLWVTAAMMRQVSVSTRMFHDSGCHRAFELVSTLYGDVECDDACTIYAFLTGAHTLARHEHY